jgi:hypothetical protein
MDRTKIVKIVFLIAINIALNVLMAIPWERVADTLLKTKKSGSKAA